jgi:hypothetical protein
MSVYEATSVILQSMNLAGILAVVMVLVAIHGTR